MEKILLLTHGGWGEGLLRSIEIILGKIDFVKEIALRPQDLLNEFQEKVDTYVEEERKAALLAREPLHITIFTDLYGGTPTNVAAVKANASPEGIDVITGLNSALLLEACTQIQIKHTLDIASLLENSSHSIFDVMAKIYGTEETHA